MQSVERHSACGSTRYSTDGCFRGKTGKGNRANLIRNKFSIKLRLVFDTAGSTTKRGGWGTRGFVALPRTKNAPFHIPRVGYAGGRLYRKHLPLAALPLFNSCIFRNIKSS